MKKLFCASLILLYLVSPAVVSASPPSVGASSAILMTSDGAVLYEKNADEALPMASTTKIMTCLIAVERCPLSDVVTVTRESVGIEGSSLYMKEGDTATVEDLVYGAMLRSANDAASALAHHIAGSDEAFAKLMNDRAESLGMSSTHFANPHGLPDDAHYTSARDFARLAACAMENGTFARIASAKEHVVTLNGSERRPVKNHNRLLFTYEGATGIKTGFTKSAGRCLVSSAERGGARLICVTFRDPDDWRDHAALLDYGFSRTERRVLFGKGEITRKIHVFGEGYVTVRNDEPLPATVVKGEKISFVTEGDRLPAPPIYAGDPVARVTAYSGGRALGTVALYAVEDVFLPEKSFYEKIKDLIR